MIAPVPTRVSWLWEHGGEVWSVNAEVRGDECDSLVLLRPGNDYMEMTVRDVGGTDEEEERLCKEAVSRAADSQYPTPSRRHEWRE